jgi:hypothetical protein
MSWRIRREGPLFDTGTKTINATRFHDELEKYLKGYCRRLRDSEWDSEVWQNFRSRMQALIDNCAVRER